MELILLFCAYAQNNIFMGRCKKTRCCRKFRSERIFKPIAVPMTDLKIIEIDVDEFEAIRLCDYEGKSQIETAKIMKISRGTVQRILNSGRNKLIDFIIHKQALKIKNNWWRSFMNICIPILADEGIGSQVYNHFGSAKYFTIYDSITKTFRTESNENMHDAHGSCQPLGIISKHNIDIVISGGMGMRAVKILNDSGVKIFLSKGNIVSEVLQYFESGSLDELTFENACSGHSCHW
jgi:uncharacterized protein